MKSINNVGKQVFLQLLEKLDEKRLMKIENEGYLPLVLERLEGSISTHAGVGTQYSLSHFYIQEGDTMRDPEMCFIVVDNRPNPEDLRFLAIYPCYFLQDNLGIEQNSILIENGFADRYYPEMQADQAVFAGQWLRNIRQQGFLKR